MIRTTIYLLLVLSARCLLAQTSESSIAEYLSFAKNSPLYKAKSGPYSFECEYLFFNHISDENPKMKQHSIHVCDPAGNYYMKQFGRVTIQDSKLKVIYDSVENQLIVDHADSLFPLQEFMSESTYESSKAPVFKQVTNGKTRFTIMLPKGSKYMGFEVEFDAQFNITQVVNYAAYAIEDENDEMIRPKLVMNYFNFAFDKTKKIPEKLGDVLLQNQGKISVTERFKEYEFIDLRYE